MFEKIYKSSIIEKPKFTLSVLIILLLSFGYFTKDFQLDASSDTLLLENDPDLKYLREINTTYGSKDFLVLTYTPKEDLLAPNTIKNLTNLKNDLASLSWANNVITILDVPLLKNNDDPITERIKNFKTLSSEDVDRERGFEEIINSPIYKEFVISKDGKTTGILVYIKTDKKLSECFMTAASPGIITTTMMNEYYDSHEKYLAAIAREMKKEYEIIHEQGLILQLDCPDLAMERSWFFQELTLPQFQERVQQHIQAINEAVTNIPKEQIRLHVCWGNSNSPHVNDVPLRDILPFLYEANVGALSLELANPRHQHEYKLFKQYPLPDSMILIPGVIDSTVNYVEHPEVVADRICQIVEAVGDRSRIIASTDCGFGTFAGLGSVATSVVWAKLKTLREGADMASRRLW